MRETAEVDTIEALMTTRAMRRFLPDPVSDDDLLTCLRAAQQAPTGGNIQPVQYLLLTEPEPKAVVGELYRRAYIRYEASLPDPTSFRTPEDEASWRRTRDASMHLALNMGDVPAIVLFLLPQIPWTPSDDEGPLDIGPLYASCYPAVQSFCVAARALGLGTALTTVIRIHTTEVREALGIPELYEIAALVPVGYPVGHFGVARRKPVEAVTHWNAWGAKRR
ncbi:MAG TPA: nitroreductase family protein [Acidimicrobiales bacterium]